MDAAWNFSPTHFNVQQSMIAQQLAVNPTAGQPAFPSIHVKPSFLAEQLNSLHISSM